MRVYLVEVAIVGGKNLGEWTAKVAGGAAGNLGPNSLDVLVVTFNPQIDTATIQNGIIRASDASYIVGSHRR